MSGHEHESEAPAEGRSKIELSRNAKGDTQIRVVILDGTTPAEATAIREVAVDQYKALQGEFYGEPGAVA